MNQDNCNQCDDFLNLVDFEGFHICPTCFEYAKRKRDAACNLLEQIKNMPSTSMEMYEKIIKVLAMRKY